MGIRAVRRAEPPLGHDGLRQRGARVVDGPGVERRRFAWDALLKQQVGGAHARVGVEAAHHPAAPQHVRQGDEDHALVMREMVRHDDAMSPASVRRILEDSG